MVQCAAFDLDATIKASIRCVEGSGRVFTATVDAGDVVFSNSRKRRVRERRRRLAVGTATVTGDWGTGGGGRKPRLTSIARRHK